MVLGIAVKRTTIVANGELLLEAKYFASREGKTLTQVIHEALAEYLDAHRHPRRSSLAGIGHSGDRDLSERTDEVLRAEIDPVGGWSPRRGPESALNDGPASDGER